MLGFHIFGYENDDPDTEGKLLPSRWRLSEKLETGRAYLVNI